MLRNPDSLLYNEALWYNTLTHEAASSGSINQTAMVHGEGCRVVDAAGRSYLDGRAGLWNATLGYSNQRIGAAIAEQARRLPVAQLIRYDQPPAIALEYARRLVEVLPGELSHVRFGCTGSQATEGAVLLSRFVRTVAGERERTHVIAFRYSYHGTGGLANALSGERPLHALSCPLAPDVHHVPAWDLAALREAVERIRPERVSCLIAEPILGTDVREAPPGMLAEIRELCTELGIHLILDEITTGFGRTGSIAAFERTGVIPDLAVFSKGMSSGYQPLSAVVASQAIFDAALAVPGFEFPHGSTADGHPLAMAAGIAVLDELADGTVFANVTERGAALTGRLRALIGHTPYVHEVRGAGLMIGVELRDAAGQPVAAAGMAAVRQACTEA
ncbi:MAG TPA: aminotransferase class III-fold pyridoxal phosphate-dependent enzyme, partial [Pseudonocardiaceae bacterium]|nr:aminotransferase class III-fold pyridoxal phosphate-dependent enzyme [Pseudonocardiaceae bacterium]